MSDLPKVTRSGGLLPGDERSRAAVRQVLEHLQAIAHSDEGIDYEPATYYEGRVDAVTTRIAEMLREVGDV